MANMKRPCEGIFQETSLKRLKLDEVLPADKKFHIHALPRDLTKLFKPLHCDLCKSPFSSPLTAATHYSGKPHQKKVKSFLSMNFPDLLLPDQNCFQPKVPIGTGQVDITMSLTPDQASVCNVCNVVFAGPIAAQQHYIGKKHRKNVLKGHIPITPVSGMDSIDPTGRHGIGLSFAPKVVRVEVEKPVLEQHRTHQKWYCDICDLQSTDENQYKSHLNGKKHVKNCKKIDLTPGFDELSPIKANPKDSILSSVIKKTHEREDDLSIFRTPSGSYYCKKCDITVNSVQQFKEHIQSKKHKRGNP